MIKAAAKSFFGGIGKRNFSTLLIAEQANSKLVENTYNSLRAAVELKEKIDVLVVGENTKATVEQISKTFPKENVDKILVMDHPSLKHYTADVYEPLITSILKKKKYKYVVANATTVGKDLLPRVAAVHDSQMISEITKIVSPDTFVRPTYASNAIATVKSEEALKFLTVRHTNFEKLKASNSDISAIEKVDAESVINSLNKDRLVKWEKEELSTGDRPELGTAKIVVSGGRGLKSGENFKLLEDLAKKLGNAAIGASRAAVDAGYVPNDYQVGQTGKVVAPELYIAVGISGAIQHLAGMKDSKVIVAINKDPDAPIFQVANYGLVGDLFKIIPEMTEKL
mmetsp:Transcript_74825/g.86874  ORF Transcript_74825/g.86874 Transcript_74825/m.86874 type:complete len:340 (-) Transcript_74825:103-1122(-)